MIPKNVDLRAAACFPLPTTWNQGKEGSCLSYAFNAAIICHQNRNDILIKNRPIVNVQNNYKHALTLGDYEEDGKGATVGDTVLALRKSNALTTEKIINMKICSHSAKKVLAKGYPIIVGYQVDNNINRFHRDQKYAKRHDFTIPRIRGDPIGSHAILFVGYDDEHFIARNSWGSNWGQNGYFLWRHEDLFDEMVTDMLYIQ